MFVNMSTWCQIAESVHFRCWPFKLVHFLHNYRCYLKTLHWHGEVRSYSMIFMIIILPNAISPRMLPVIISERTRHKEVPHVKQRHHSTMCIMAYTEHPLRKTQDIHNERHKTLITKGINGNRKTQLHNWIKLTKLNMLRVSKYYESIFVFWLIFNTRNQCSN